MEKPFGDLSRLLEPGQRVQLETGSAIYRGPYESSVLSADGEGLRVAVPMENGKLVLIPVGTRIVVRSETGSGPIAFETVVVDRTGGRNRSLLLRRPEPPGAREREAGSVPFIAVSSGKGGVGKTTLAVNLGIALARLGKRVCVIDGDLGTANVDVLLNLATPYNLAHVIHGEKHMLEVVVEGPEGMIVLPGGSGLQELTVLSESKFNALLRQFQQLEAYADVILIDTGTGLSPNVTKFIMASDEAILITTPEPHAITDCYALIKVLASGGSSTPLHLVINRVQSDLEAEDIAQKMVFASRRFLHTDLKVLGHIVEDQAVIRSIRRQVPLMLEHARSRPAQQISQIAERVVGIEKEAVQQGGARAFFERMRRLMPLRG